MPLSSTFPGSGAATRVQVRGRVALRAQDLVRLVDHAFSFSRRRSLTTFGIRLAAGLLHHLADEEAEQALLAAPVRLDLAGVGGEDRVDERLELGGV